MPLFPGFTRRRIRTSGATLNLVTGGEGPPLLRLHGYPETHAMWHRMAPQLAREYPWCVPACAATAIRPSRRACRIFRTTPSAPWRRTWPR